MPRVKVGDVVRAVSSDLERNAIDEDQFLGKLASKSPLSKQKFDSFRAGKLGDAEFNPGTIKSITEAMTEVGSFDNPTILKLQRQKGNVTLDDDKSAYHNVFQPLANVQKERGYQVRHLFRGKPEAHFITLMNDIDQDRVILVDLTLSKSSEIIEFEFGKLSREARFKENPDTSPSLYAPYKGVAHVTEEYLYCFGTCSLKELEPYAPLYLIVDARNISRSIGYTGFLTSQFDSNKRIYSTKVLIGRVETLKGVKLGSVEITEDEKKVKTWLKKGYQNVSPGGDDPPPGMTTLLKRLGCGPG